MTSPSIWPLVAWLAATPVALATVCVGWRWRCVPIPASCRRCGYDVSQRPTGVDLCSECGADLTRRRAIITVRRRPHRWITAFALLTTFVLVTTVVVRATNFDWQAFYVRLAPLALIEHHARADLRATGDIYRWEWRNRKKDSALYLDHLLDIQADATVPWRSGLCGEFDRLLKWQAFDEGQQKRYLDALLKTPVSVRLSEPPRVGQSLKLDVEFDLRAGTEATHFYWNLAVKTDSSPKPPSITIDPRLPVQPFVRGIVSGRRKRSEVRFFRDWGATDGKPEGRHQLHVVIRRQWVSHEPLSTQGEQDAFLPIDSEFVIDTDVLPDRPYVRIPIREGGFADNVAESVGIRLSRRKDNFFFAEVRLGPAEVDRSFIINAVVDGQIKPMGTIVAAAGKSAESITLNVPLSVVQKKSLKAVTFTLVGSATPLKAVADPKQSFWDGSVVVEAVPLDGNFIAGKPVEAGASTK